MDQRKQLRQLWQFLRPYQMHLILCTVMIGLQVAVNLTVSLFLGQALDSGVWASATGFWRAFAGLMLSWVAGDFIFYHRFRLLRQTAERVAHDLRQAATCVISRTRMSELEQKHSGDLVSRLSSDIVLIRNLIAQDWVSLSYGVIAFFAGLIMMLYISWSVTLSVLVAVPLIGLVANGLGKPLGRHTTAMQARLADVNALAQDALAGITVSKAFNLRPQLAMRFRQHSEQVAAEGIQVASYQGLLSGSMMALTLLPVFIVFGFGGYQVIVGRLTLGKMIVLLNLLNNLTWPLNRMARSLAQAKAGLTASERIFAVLELERERVGGNELIVDATASAIELEDIHFAYETSPVIISGLNLNIAHGERVAIVGASGSGKSTLFSLLLGLREPQSGNIRFYGQPLTDLSLASVRQAIAYVPQEALLFPTSVTENIAYGNLEGEQEAIIKAARDAFADEFITSLPDSYATNLGEYGSGISGGQKQRVSLARAIVKDAPILLLDEATSALDTESEAQVQAAIEQLSQKRTTLIIAHRLSTIKAVDRILVLEGGAIVEAGTHGELLRLGGVYARLYAQQFAAPAVGSVAVGN